MLTRSKRRKLDQHDDKHIEREDGVTTVATVTIHHGGDGGSACASASTRMFQMGVLVDQVFSFLHDGERVNLVVNKLTRCRSLLTPSWPPRRYFCPSMEVKHPILHLVPKMALTTVLLSGYDVGTGSFGEDGGTDQAKVYDKIIDAHRHSTVYATERPETEDCDFRLVLAGSKKTLRCVELCEIYLTRDQIFSMVDWVPNLTSLFISDGNVSHFGSLCRTHRAHNEGTGTIEGIEGKDEAGQLFPEM